MVLDDNHLRIKPITEFIRYLNNIDKSPFTVRSYAHHLKLFREYLDTKQILWTAINLASLAGFVGWLRDRDKDRRVIDLAEDHAAGKGSTINVILVVYPVLSLPQSTWQH